MVFLNNKVFYLLIIIWVVVLSIWMGHYLQVREKKKVIIPYRSREDVNWAEVTDEEVNFMCDAFEELSDRIKEEKGLKLYLKAQLPDLGDLGKPAYLTKHYAYYVTKVLRMKGINVLLSNKMMLDRRLPDVRYPICRNLFYYTKELPSVSIIMPFHDEPASIIVRALHSIVRETPPELIREIILVDDNSEEDELHGSLRNYIRTRLPTESDVVLVRLYKRYGTVKARLEGARSSKGQVLVFVDPHTEVTKGWLEPMLQRIKQKVDAVVVPIIDTISPMTFEYQPQNDTKIIGGFTWDGKATWIKIPKRLMNGRNTLADPIETPVMVGPIFAVHKFYFLKFGSYDVDMVGSGGEHLEMSFRTWQCGGSLEVIPCSRVGHLFRGSLSYKYKFPNNNTSAELYDLTRAVNVWMDHYSRLFYLHNKQEEFGNIEDRLMVKEYLKCKSFKWYLEHIYPEKFISDQNVIAYGKVRSALNNLCLDVSKLYSDRALERLKVAECKDNSTHNQFFSLTNEGFLRTEFRCASIELNARKVEMRDCDDLHYLTKWKLLQDGSLVHPTSGLCLDARHMKQNQEISVKSCNKSPGQTWKFDYYGEVI